MEAMQPAIVMSPRQQLDRAIGDMRVVGGVLVGLGGLPLLALYLSQFRSDGWGAQILTLVNTVILVGPGVWYLVAAAMIRRLNRQAVRNSMRVALAQLVLVPSVLLAASLARAPGREVAMFLVPAMLAVFLVPALIALLFVLRRISRLMNEMGPEGKGFEPIPVANRDQVASRERDC